MDWAAGDAGPRCSELLNTAICRSASTSALRSRDSCGVVSVVQARAWDEVIMGQAAEQERRADLGGLVAQHGLVLQRLGHFHIGIVGAFAQCLWCVSERWSHG